MDLVTIAFSHYCEKARWALDRARVHYREHRTMPGFHVPVAMRMLAGTGRGRADRASSRFSTPILRGPGVLLTDSSEIVRWADAEHAHEGWYDAPEAAALEARFGDELGPHTRRIVYWHALRERRLMDDMARRNVGPVQARLFLAALPLVSRQLTRRLGLDERGYRRSIERVDRVVAEVDARLSDGRRYLCGDRFGAADLAFAALMAPVVLPGPDRYGAVLPGLDELPSEMQRWVERLRERPAGRFAMRMFAEERPARAT